MREYAIEKIDPAKGIQARDSLCVDTVNRYKELILDGIEMPPGRAFEVSNQILLVDFYHRYHGNVAARKETVWLYVKPGTYEEALQFALGANANHGLPRSNRDKRKGVRMALDHFPNFSSREIAKLVGVSHTFVDNFRNERSADLLIEGDHVATVASPAKSRPKEEGRVATGGKTALIDQSIVANQVATVATPTKTGPKKDGSEGTGGGTVLTSQRTVGPGTQSQRSEACQVAPSTHLSRESFSEGSDCPWWSPVEQIIRNTYSSFNDVHLRQDFCTRLGILIESLND